MRLERLRLLGLQAAPIAAVACGLTHRGFPESNRCMLVALFPALDPLDANGQRGCFGQPLNPDEKALWLVSRLGQDLASYAVCVALLLVGVVILTAFGPMTRRTTSTLRATSATLAVTTITVSALLYTADLSLWTMLRR